MTMRTKSCSTMRLSASAPDFARTIRHPNGSSTASKASRLDSLSSTARIVGGGSSTELVTTGQEVPRVRSSVKSAGPSRTRKGPAASNSCRTEDRRSPPSRGRRQGGGPHSSLDEGAKTIEVDRLVQQEVRDAPKEGSG